MTDSIARFLPHFNAAMNATSAIFLVFGIYFIIKKREDAHRNCMSAAVTASALFLTGYFLRHILTGTVHFQGTGVLRTMYLWILTSHMILAGVSTPLVLRVLYLGIKDRRDEHKRLGRWSVPIWFYVSITGIVVYVMLYRISPEGAAQ